MNDYLYQLTYVLPLSTKLSVSDVLLFITLSKKLVKMSLTELNEFPNVLRYFNFIQTSLSEYAVIDIIDVYGSEIVILVC